MKKLKKKIMKSAKKNIAKQIGKQLKKILQKKAGISDVAFLNFAKRYAEHVTLQAMGERPASKNVSGAKKYSSTVSSGISSKKNKKFKIKVKGMNKVARDVMKGKDVGKAIKDNAGIFATFSFKW